MSRTNRKYHTAQPGAIPGSAAMDDCKTNVRVSPFRANFEKRFVSGRDFSRAKNGQ